MDAQLCAARDHHRAQIERRALGRWDPVLLDPDKLLHGPDLEFRVERRHAQTLGAAVHTQGVFHRAEHLDAAVLAAVDLQTLKDLLTVVQDGRSRVDLQRAVGHDAGVMPAGTHGVFHDKHVVGKDLTEAKVRFIGGLLLGSRRFHEFDFQIHHCNVSF